MKKLLTLALCLSVAGASFAQETAKSLYDAGKQQFKTFDEGMIKLKINPNDKNIDPVDMSQQLLNGYESFMKALPLDSLPDAKGKVKPKYSKDIIGRLNAHLNDFNIAGAKFYEAKKYYPEAYTAFMIYGDMPKAYYADKQVAATPDSTVNTAYFNAGLCAYAGNALPEGAVAFKKARLNNSDNSQNYIYELACWQYMAQNDSTLEDEAKKAIEEIATAGYKKFGISEMLFVNNLINSMVQEDRNQDAVNLVNELMATNPDNPALYGLRGFVYDRMDNDDASVADYRKAASLPGVDAETLKNVGRKLFKVGTSKLNALEGNDQAARNAIKSDYFEAAKSAIEKAKALNPDTSDVDVILESIDYALTTYF